MRSFKQTSVIGVPGVFLADAFGTTPEEREDLRLLIRTIAYAMGLALMEERALFGADAPSAELLRFGDFVMRASERLLATRASLGPIAAPREPAET